MRTLGAALVVLVFSGLASRAAVTIPPYGDTTERTDEQYTRYPYLCELSEAAGTTAWPDGCCEDLEASPYDWNCAGADTDAATDWRNILLLVTDDQAYCEYGFMAGVCSKPYDDGATERWISCSSEADCLPKCVEFNQVAGGGVGGNTFCASEVLTSAYHCTNGECDECEDDAECESAEEAPDLGSCVATSDLGTCSNSASETCAHDGECNGGTCDHESPPTDPPPPLRLNDLSCRNRQPRRRSDAYCSGDAAGLDANHLRYSRWYAPCPDTPMEARPVYHTPHLDELAATGVVFPRAYVAGVTCKNSRRAMMHGRYQRHLQYLFEEGGKGQDECERGDSSIDERHRGCDAAGDCNDGRADAVCGEALALARWMNQAVGTVLADAPGGGGCVENECADGGALCSVDVDCPGPYVSYAFAKTDNMDASQGGFDAAHTNTNRAVGRVKCKQRRVDTSECLETVDDGGTEGSGGVLRYRDEPHFTSVHLEAHFDVKGHLYRLVHAMDGREPEPVDEGGETHGPVMVKVGDKEWVQRRPWFIWFGPNIPHHNSTAEQIFRDLYDPDPDDGDHPYDRDEWNHHGRVSWLDWIVGGLRYHLKRACSCSRAGTIQSLEDNTTIIILSDHGFLPSDAKTTITENGERTVLIVNSPDDRNDSTLDLADRVFRDEIPDAVDLLPTILEYSAEARGSSEERRFFSASAALLQEDYPHGRGLRTWIAQLRGGGSVTERRHLVYGEFGGGTDAESNNTDTKGFPRFLVTKPGLFGVCDDWYPDGGNPFTEDVRVHPCLSDDDCDDEGLGTCQCPPDSPACSSESTQTGKWKRCINVPGRTCSDDSTCTQNLCANGTCFTTVTALSPHIFRDFEGKACTEDEQCAPPGICRPLTLRFISKKFENGVPKLSHVYDAEMDPDDQFDMLSELPAGYMDTTSPGDLRDKIEACQAHFAHLENYNTGQSGLETWHDDGDFTCDSTWNLVNHLRPSGNFDAWWKDEP